MRVAATAMIAAIHGAAKLGAQMGIGARLALVMARAAWIIAVAGIGALRMAGLCALSACPALLAGAARALAAAFTPWRALLAAGLLHACSIKFAAFCPGSCAALGWTLLLVILRTWAAIGLTERSTIL